MADENPAAPERLRSTAREEALREQLARAILGGEAHLDAAAVFQGVAPEHWGARLAGAPHTLWQLLEHMRFTLHDLLVFSTDPGYTEPAWPDDYWPKADAPAGETEAQQGVAALLQAQTAMAQLVKTADHDLFAPIPWGQGQTILREALLAATHTSYHLGQALWLRRQLEGGATPS